jgi:hypothetical protein
VGVLRRDIARCGAAASGSVFGAPTILVQRSSRKLGRPLPLRTVSFFPTAENPGTPRGAFRVTVRELPATGEFEITPGRWLERPPNCGALPFRGKFSRVPDRDLFVGALMGQGCGLIELSRPTRAAPPPLAASAPAPALSRLPDHILGVWEGEYECGTGQRAARADVTLTIPPGDAPATLRVTGLRGASGAQAAYRVALDPALGGVRLTPTLSHRRAREAHELPISGLLSPDRERITGRFEGGQCGTIELARIRDAIPAPEARAAVSVLQAGATDEACTAIALWAKRLVDEYPVEQMRSPVALANLIREEHFRPHIGVAYGTLDRAGFQRLSAIQQRCIQRGLLDAVPEPARGILRGQNANRFADPLQAQAVALDWRARALAAAEAVPATIEGLETLARLKTVADREMAALWPSERRAFRETLIEREATAIEEAMTAIAGRDPSAPLTLDRIAELHRLAVLAGNAGTRVRARVDNAPAQHLDAAFTVAARLPATSAGRTAFLEWQQNLDREIAGYADYSAVQAARARLPIEFRALNDRIDLAFIGAPETAPSLDRLSRLEDLAASRPADVADPARAAFERELAQLAAAQLAEGAQFEESAAGLARFDSWLAAFTRDFSRHAGTAPIREAQRALAQRRIVLAIAAAADEAAQIRQSDHPDLARLVVLNDQLIALREQLPLADSSEAERRLAGVEAAVAVAVSGMIAAEAEALRGLPASLEGLQRLSAARGELGLRYARFLSVPAYRQVMDGLTQQEGSVAEAILLPATRQAASFGIDDLAAHHDRVVALRALTGAANAGAEAAYARADAAVAEGVRRHLSRAQASLRENPRTPEGLVRLAAESEATLRQFARLARHPAYQEVVRGPAESASAHLADVRGEVASAVEGSVSATAARDVRLSIEAVEARVPPPVAAALWEAFNTGLSRWLTVQVASIPAAARLGAPQGNLMGSFGQQQAAAPISSSLREVCRQANLSTEPERFCACAGPALERRLDTAQQAFLRHNPPVTSAILVEVVPRLDADLRQCASQPAASRACTAQELAGSYETSPGGALRCDAAGSDRLACCYGQTCGNQMLLQLGQDGRSLTGTYGLAQTQERGEVELGVTAECAIASGRLSWTSTFMGRRETNWSPFQVLRRLETAETGPSPHGGSVPPLAGLLGGQAARESTSGAGTRNVADFERPELLRALIARDMAALTGFRAGLLPEEHGIPQGLIIYFLSFNAVMSQVVECATLMPAGFDAELRRVITMRSLQGDRMVGMGADFLGRMVPDGRSQSPATVSGVGALLGPLAEGRAIRDRLESEGRRDALLFLRQTNCDGPTARAVADGARALMNHFRTLP